MNVFILTGIRSGSTYLINMLNQTSLFHYPESWSQHPSLIDQRIINEFFAPNHNIDPWLENSKTRDQTISHLKYKLSFIRQEPCLFKVLMEQYQYYLLDAKDRLLLEKLIPDLRYIWLERSDIIARTVSAYMFFKSTTAHLATQQEYDNYMKKAIEVDEQGLIDVYKNHVKRANWSEFLDGTNYLKINYEDLVAKPFQTMQRILLFLGLNLLNKNLMEIVEAQPKFKTERPESKEWQEKLRRILRKRTI